jgi:hypothetical protein
VRRCGPSGTSHTAALPASHLPCCPAAKTNYPLQDYAEDLQLHKELRARENGDELLLLPLEELQAHLQQHMQELLPKQPALQKVYSDWSRRKAQSEALVQLSKDRMRHAHGIPYWVEGHPGDASGGGSVGHSDWVCDTADAASGELMQAPRSNSNGLPASLLEQQWSSSLPGHQQEAQQQQRVQAQQMPAELSEATRQMLQHTHQLQQQNSSRHSSPTGTQEGGSSRNSPPAAAAAGGSSGGSNGRAGAASSGGTRGASNSAQRQQREPPKTLQQHLLTRLHEQRVHRSSSGTSMEALLAAAAVLEEEEEVAATMCGQLHELVSAAQAAQADAAAATAAAIAGSKQEAVATALAAAAAAAAAAAGGDSADLAAVRKGPKSGRTHRIKQGTVVTDTAAIVAAILTSPTSLHVQADAAPWQQQQQEDKAPAAAAAADAAPDGGSEQQQKLQEEEDQRQLSPLGALHQRLLQPPTTEQQVMQTVQLADKAGLNKDGQQLLLLVMYHQLLDLQRQQERQQPQAQPASAAPAPTQEPAAQPAPQHPAGPSSKPTDASATTHNQLPAQQQARGSMKRPQDAQEPEQRPAKQVCQGVGSGQPSRLAAALASATCSQSQGASRSLLPTKAVLDLSSC